jgi:hypothetical protein
MTLDQLRKATALCEELGAIIGNTYIKDEDRMACIEDHHEWLLNNLREELSLQEKAALLERLIPVTIV